MSTQRKPEKFPVQILSLDAIRVDHSIQSRVATSIAYQREFSGAMLRGDVFPPVTVFFDGEVYWLADGFHRYGAAREASKVDPNLRGLKAEVREGTRQDAILFSAGANQKFSIPRTREDIRKAIELLLSVDGCRIWSPRRIALHVGTSETPVRKYRMEFFVKHNLPIPSNVVGNDGVKRATSNEPLRLGTCKSADGKKAIKFRTHYRGKEIPLGTDEAVAKEKIAELRSQQETRMSYRWDLSGHHHVVDGRFRGNEVILHTAFSRGHPYSGLWGYTGHGCVVVWTDLAAPEALPLHVGIVLAAREHVDPSARAVVICYHEDAAPAVLELYRRPRFGVEFLTPDEFIASVGGTAEESTPPASSPPLDPAAPSAPPP